MRVLLLHDRCGYQGGVEQHLADVSVLARRGHEVHLAHGPQPARDASAFAALFDSVWPVAELGVDGATGVLEVLRVVQPDVLYVHRAEAAGALLETVRAAPCYATALRAVRMIHDHDVYCPRRHKYYAWSGEGCTSPPGWRCIFDGAFVRRAPGTRWGLEWVDLAEHARELRRQAGFDRLLVASRYMRDQLVQSSMPAARVHVLRMASRAAQQLPGMGVRHEVPLEPGLLYVGQLVRGKGVDLLRRAAARVPGRWRLDVVGVGNALPSLRALSASLGLESRVRWRGWLDERGLDEAYRAARVVVVPSRWPEPFGMVGLEAMRRGRAGAAYEVGGVSEWLEHQRTGLLVPPASIAGLAQALEALLYQPGLAEELGAHGQRRVAERFSLEGFLQDLERHLLLLP
jgi:glycosyltransferase involved in cell wall biosynthesis